MKKIIGIVVIVLIVSFSGSASANGISVIIDGKKQVYAQPPVLLKGTTLVPLRGIFEDLGATVQWEASTKTITAMKGGTKVVLQIGSKTALINGAKKSISTPAQVINGSTMVPLRFVTESYGASVNWSGTTKTITIQSSDKDKGPKVVDIY